MKTKQQIKPSYAPLYCSAMYPQLAEVCKEHGYALAVHGSLQNDLDLIAIPWTEEAVTPRKLMNEIQNTLAIKFDKATNKLYGRKAYEAHVGFGVCRLDFSIFPELLKKEWK